MEKFSVGFIGLGLIGGSIAHSLRELYPKCNIIAYHYNKNKRNLNLETGVLDGTINLITDNLANGFDQCDLIFLCAPVLTNISYLPMLKPIIKPNCIITDVGSVKGNIHNAVKDASLEENFIGGHPMTGSEKIGYNNASSKLLENAFYILTPTKKTPNWIIKKMSSLIDEIRAIPIILDHNEHDDITAAISHVPHIIAANLVNMVKTSDNGSEKMKILAAGGFKDITRIASSSPIIWENICLTNHSSIKKFLILYKNSIDEFIQALDQKNASFIYQNFESAKEYRDSIPSKSIGMFENLYEIYLDINDETGAIASIATILANNSISIKNIGIIHNREFEEGVLRIELYNQISIDNTIDLLRQFNYTIYER
jgi:prephenate dehydrogenase